MTLKLNILSCSNNYSNLENSSIEIDCKDLRELQLEYENDDISRDEYLIKYLLNFVDWFKLKFNCNKEIKNMIFIIKSNLFNIEIDLDITKCQLNTQTNLIYLLNNI